MPKFEDARTKRLYEQAKKLVGKKAILTGGGGLMQESAIVKVIDVRLTTHFRNPKYKIGQATVYNGEKRFEPYLSSWVLSPLNTKGKKLPLGEYFDNLDGTATNKTTRKTFNLKKL